MQMRWVARLAFALVLFTMVIVPRAGKAEASCHEVENCTFCYYYNNGAYAGYLKWCKPLN